MLDYKPILLIVDDMPANIQVLSSILKDEYRIKAATDGLKAIEIATGEDKIDLILLDILMPGMDGYQVCRKLKNIEQTCNIPIIFVTAKNDVHDEEHGFNLGAVDYIVKPFHPTIVKARVRNQVNLKLRTDILAEYAMLDGLTQIHNRRHLDNSLPKIFSDVLNDKKSISALMVDVDHFKDYNDNYGHGKGDQCLFQIASALKTAIDPRRHDLVARYGGEEFAIILPHAGKSEATDLAKKLCDTVNKLQIPHEYSSVASHITVSIGIAAYDKNTNYNQLDYKGLLELADSALYKAKANGRNRFELAEA